MNVLGKRKFLFVGAVVAMSCSTTTFSISYNDLKHLRSQDGEFRSMALEQPKIKFMLQDIAQPRSFELEEAGLTGVVIDLQERLGQCGVLLEQYDQLLARLGAIFGKKTFQVQDIIDEIYRLKKERAVLKGERDRALGLLDELADFAEDQKDQEVHKS